jgi:hypothetical protein
MWGHISIYLHLGGTAKRSSSLNRLKTVVELSVGQLKKVLVGKFQPREQIRIPALHIYIVRTIQAFRLRIDRTWDSRFVF